MICFAYAQTGCTPVMYCNISLGDSSSTSRKHSVRVNVTKLDWMVHLCRYAGVFLLKAIFLNAVASSERRSTVRLLRRLIICLAGTSSDVSLIWNVVDPGCRADLMETLPASSSCREICPTSRQPTEDLLQRTRRCGHQLSTRSSEPGRRKTNGTSRQGCH